MERTVLGRTGVEVSRLGVGLAEVGRLALSDVDRAARLLNMALDAGVNFLDTAACYNNSEELVGRAVSHRRSEFFLATKCGHAVAGYPGRPWTAQTVRDSIDRSLHRLRTDYLDLVQLHSCGVEVLERGEVIEALKEAQEAGKTRFIGYSGDNEAARWALESGHFDTLQTSFNLVDQRARTRLFPLAEERGVGIIIKRPIANAVWGRRTSPSAYADEYLRRAQAMAALGPLSGAPEDPVALALAFVMAHPEVDVAIVGTANPDHMAANLRLVTAGLSLPGAAVEELHRRFEALDHDWVQLM